MAGGYNEGINLAEPVAYVVIVVAIIGFYWLCTKLMDEDGGKKNDV